jgi:sugar lactone lactonase YvrE
MRTKTWMLFVVCFLNGTHVGKGQSGSYTFSTISGQVGIIGAEDGTNNLATFNFPGKIVADGTGVLYVSDILNHTIRQVMARGSNWVTRTLTGQSGVPGSMDGTNQEALFDRPNGVAVDSAGNLFVVDHYNHTIRKVTAVGTNWVVTTIAGMAGVHGSEDGTNTDARFWSPTGIATTTDGRLYVTDTANFTIRELVPAGTNWAVRTIAGVPLNYGFQDGTNGDAQFDYPYGIAVGGASGSLYVVDWGNNAIRELQSIGTNWVVTTIAGTSGEMGSRDGPGNIATFNFPNDITADRWGNLYVTDQSNDTLRKLVFSAGDWSVTTIGGAVLVAGNADGFGREARFKHPWGVAADASGTLYVTDYGNQTIRAGVFVPALNVQFVLQQVVLSWPLDSGNFVVESSSSIDAVSNWSVMTNPWVTNGLKLMMVDKPGTPNTFYRLHRIQP